MLTAWKHPICIQWPQECFTSFVVYYSAKSAFTWNRALIMLVVLMSVATWLDSSSCQGDNYIYPLGPELFGTRKSVSNDPHSQQKTVWLPIQPSTPYSGWKNMKSCIYSWPKRDIMYGVGPIKSCQQYTRWGCSFIISTLHSITCGIWFWVVSCLKKVPLYDDY